MDAREYFDAIVRPLFEDCKGREFPHFLIIPTAVMLFHVLDYLSQGDETRRVTLEKEGLEEFPDLDSLRILANVSKHFRLTRGKSSGQEISQVRRARNTIIAVGGKALVIGGKAYYFKHPPQLLLDDKAINLVDLIERAYFFFDEFIKKNTHSKP